jgi:hypothetical protein
MTQGLYAHMNNKKERANILMNLDAKVFSKVFPKTTK